ncbi:MAG TPA: glycosyltransferase, partial [Pseudolabrys sp.]
MTPRALSGATILQIVPALRGDAVGHAAMDTAVLLLQGGARTIIAGDDGDLVGELRALGGEFLPLGRETFNPVQLRGNARFLRDYVLTERVDIVHAHSAAAAWSALSALHELPAWLVTSFPDAIARDTWLRRTYQGVLARGDRVIAPSSFVSLAMIERYGIAPDRIAVVPRSIDTAAFSASAV